jgi:hypothetical protein
LSFLQEGTHREEYRDDDVFCCDRIFVDGLNIVSVHGGLQRSLLTRWKGKEIYMAPAFACFTGKDRGISYQKPKDWDCCEDVDSGEKSLIF